MTGGHVQGDLLAPEDVVSLLIDDPQLEQKLKEIPAQAKDRQKKRTTKGIRVDDEGDAFFEDEVKDGTPVENEDPFPEPEKTTPVNKKRKAAAATDKAPPKPRPPKCSKNLDSLATPGSESHDRLPSSDMQQQIPKRSKRPTKSVNEHLELEYANAGGNWRLIEALCEGAPIFYNKTVETIRYGNDGVEVIAGDQTIQADMVLCTVPLGVLKKKTVKFVPELPERKLKAIEKLGFGLLNKVAMVFPSVFWGEDLDTFGCLSKNSATRGEFFLFYGYHTVSGGSVLVALVAGEAAQSFEQTQPSTLLHRVLSILRGIYGPKGVEVPDPIQSICTKWGNDPLSYGSYSHVRVHSSGSDYDVLAENVENRLFFAGEATTRQHPATMHGAYLSGLREASCIYRASRGSKPIHNPRKSFRKVVGVSDTLVNLFKYPDIAFGNFSFVFDPSNQDPKSTGILMVTVDSFSSELGDDNGNVKNSQQSDKQPLKLYTTVTRVQAHELESEVGGVESQLKYLCKSLGLKLMGSDSFALIANSLISNVASRRARVRNRRVAVGNVSYK